LSGWNSQYDPSTGKYVPVSKSLKPVVSADITGSAKEYAKSMKDRPLKDVYEVPSLPCSPMIK